MKNLILCLSATVILAACGGSNSSQSQVTETTVSAKSSAGLTPVQRGKKIYKRCKACHTLEQDGRHKVGPNLWDIYGSKTAAKEGFAYSKAMKAADIIWDETEMDAYLKKPSTYMPGNKMTFIGLKKQEDRDAVQAYMKEQTTP